MLLYFSLVLPCEYWATVAKLQISNSGKKLRAFLRRRIGKRSLKNYISLNKMLLEIWRLKAWLPVRALVEVRSILEKSRSGHGKTDWFQIGKGVHQGCILSPCLFNLYEEYIMRNTGLDEVQAGIRTSRRSINNLRYADNTTLMAETEEELKSLLMKVKEESEIVGLKLNIQKTKIMASGPITSWLIDGETVETVTHYFWGLQNHCRLWLQPWN